MESEFRGALDYSGGDGTPPDRSRKRESWLTWVTDDLEPAQETASPADDDQDRASYNGTPNASNDRAHNAPDAEFGLARSGRSFSLPHIKQGGTAPGWLRLKQRLQRQSTMAQPRAAVVAPTNVNIVDELIEGGLSGIMLKMWFERDDRDERRVPILLQRLKIRISDSLHPLSGSKAVFRIECEYASGQSRWVVYRQLRDFASLHTHYRLSNAYNRNIDQMPEFPKTSAPYFNWLKTQAEKDGRDIANADFARIQRESIERYLVQLIRVVMFHPTANRLCRFLEVSALSLQLAETGGWQHKAGVMRIEPVGKTGAFSRRGLGWREKRKSRWCSVRESYLVVVEEPGELRVHDVFLLDSDFLVERPTRYLRKGLHMLHLADEDEPHDAANPEIHAGSPQTPRSLSSSRRPSHDSQQRHHTRTSTSGTSMANKGKASLTLRKIFTVGSRRTNRSSRSSATSHTSSAETSRAPTPLDDPSTNRAPTGPPAQIVPDTLEQQIQDRLTVPDGSGKKRRRGKDKDKDNSKTNDLSHRTFYVENSQMRLKLTARNERQMDQWIAALERAAATTHWTQENRFGSFAPIRLNVSSQWLVDGRDYYWNVSRALLMAKERILIHDWWLSPELLLRRPGREQYRLDRLLERKAREGVKIFVILYNEVSNRTTPTDSYYAKQRLIGLHENIVVQRSPSHFQTGTFYWAHHEKLCVIDDTIAFMGGFDLCFGRWDTPQHVLVDETEGEHIWQGKDYSNPRVSDFHTLNKPEQEMYDRSKVPRMPWHDVGMQILGQPARDLARHFIQRWNYLLRVKNHTRSLPFLLPAPDFKPAQLEELNLTGTCELQICRSAGPWSMGTPNRTEDSIHNAYLKAIQLSEHFIYIENQFFITSTVVGETRVENHIGDALVNRIIRAHDEGTPWHAVILIPLLPGFPFPIGHSDAAAIRVIYECQTRTISRGPHSIFARLRREGIEPSDYISFYSLRGWGKVGGETLTTEQVYIHAKIMIADDRVAIIGSANINERSMRGDRDSELAAIIRDTDMIDSTMAGEPFQVGRFAHELRLRLMREHLGIDVDALIAEQLAELDLTNAPVDPHQIAPELSVSAPTPAEKEEKDAELESHGDATSQAGLSTTGSSHESRLGSSKGVTPPTSSDPETTSQHVRSSSRTMKPSIRRHLGTLKRKLVQSRPKVDANAFIDPLLPTFFDDMWVAAAHHNTDIYRRVFKAIPDDNVTSWKQYRDYVQYHDRFTKSQGSQRPPTPALGRESSEQTADRSEGVAVDVEQVAKDEHVSTSEVEESRPDLSTADRTSPDLLGPPGSKLSDRQRKHSRPDQPFEAWEREEFEGQLAELVGNLVVYPTRFLEGEDLANNFMFPSDRIHPLSIYD
ncbi:phospholipase D [Auriculariales sp. MPI-PUGE-AT-0066]|nr:phospholipase D [Auriculariales sp. MPI-PUGE-AT-0066]